MEATSRVWFTASGVGGETGGGRDLGAAALDDLARSLEALGLSAEVEDLGRGRFAVEIRYPAPYDAEVARTRRAGRRVAYSPHSSPVFDSETTLEDGVAWLESHTTEEGMRALCCPRSTYFRWKRKAADALEAERRINASRAATGAPELRHRLADALRSRR